MTEYRKQMLRLEIQKNTLILEEELVVADALETKLFLIEKELKSDYIDEDDAEVLKSDKKRIEKVLNKTWEKLAALQELRKK